MFLLVIITFFPRAKFMNKKFFNTTSIVVQLKQIIKR